MRLWQGATLPATYGAPQFTLTFNNPGTVRHVFSPSVEINGAEAFIRGEFDIQGDIFSAFGLLRQMSATLRSAKSAGILLRNWLSLPYEPQLTTAQRQAKLSGAKHSKQRDQAAIQHHYDVGNDFYALFLDPRMIYSCAYFPTGAEALATAQERKLDMICRKLRLQPDERVLDIGCGWGG
jgi:cyclopropane-fatty-acyl-phospholipid synthase